MSHMGAAVLVAVAQLLGAAMVHGPPPPGPPPGPPPRGALPTTAAPTDAPHLVSPLDGELADDVFGAPRGALSTRLSVVKHHASTWPTRPLPRVTSTPHPSRSTASLGRPPKARGMEDALATPATPVTLATPITLATPSSLAAPATVATPTSLVSLGSTSSKAKLSKVLRDDRGARAVWNMPAADADPPEETSSEYYRRYYASPTGSAAGAASNTSWWSAGQRPVLGPAFGQGLGLGQGLGFGHGGLGQGLSLGPATALRRASHHHHHKPFVAAHWEDPDYGDSASGGSQVVALAHSHPHPPPQHHQPVYYVADHKKEDSWSDLTTKLIVLAVIKLLIVKALGLGAFKLFIIGLIKIPIAFAAFALKFAVVVKFFKFIKIAEGVFLAVLVIPVILIAVVPLLLPILIPLGLLIIPLLLLPLLLLFPVPVLTPGQNGGGTVITITPGRRRREEEEQALAQLESRVADSRRCLQKMACDVGYRSQAVKGYADWVLWLMGLIKPILGEAKRNQLKGFLSAYKAGLGGRSCYRKYPCYANNMNTKRANGKAKGKGASRKAVEAAVSRGGNGTAIATAKSSELDSGSSSSVEERIVYDPVSGSGGGGSSNNSTNNEAAAVEEATRRRRTTARR